MTSVYNPFQGLPQNLVPDPPPAMPEAPGIQDAMVSLSPFKEALDVAAIIKNLVLDRPLKLFIPDRWKYPEWEFRIINAIPREVADAHNKGWREVDDEQLTGLFRDLVAGTDKNGKAYAPLLMGRPKEVGKVIQKRVRKQLASIYAGMDPRNKEFDSKYVDRVDERGLTHGKFTGEGWRIRS